MPDETFHNNCPVTKSAAITYGFGAVPVAGLFVAIVFTEIIDSKSAVPNVENGHVMLLLMFAVKLLVRLLRVQLIRRYLLAPAAAPRS